MSAQNEIWQVVVNGEVYQTDTSTIKQWVAEGRILPTDKVKKGNFSWIEANRVPMLRRVFAGEETSEPDLQSPQMPPAEQNYSEQQGYAGQQGYSAQQNYSEPVSYDMGGAAFQPVYNPGMSSSPAMSTMASVCYYHPELLPDY